MALNKLYYVYGLDTACFYTDKENEIEKYLLKARRVKNRFKQRYVDNKNNLSPKRQKLYQQLNKLVIRLKSELKEELHKNIGLTRNVRMDKIVDKNGEPSIRKRVSIFDSSLTRYFGLKEREFNTEILIIKVYFYDVAESIVKNGFYMNGYKYKFFSASAGQIRTKKLVAVREDLLLKYWNALTAGLTVEKINKLGGMNINKYLAYLALCNSATDLWEDFNIDRCIVVDDFENIESVYNALTDMNVCCADDSELGIQDSIVNASNIFSFASVFLIISTVLLSVIMIIQSTANALSLRKSDIGLLKAIGYRNSQIFACLYCEQLRVTFTGFAVGTIISIIVTAVSNFFFANRNFIDRLYIINWRTFGILLAISFLIVTVVPLICQLIALRKLNKIQPKDAMNE